MCVGVCVRVQGEVHVCHDDNKSINIALHASSQRLKATTTATVQASTNLLPKRGCIQVHLLYPRSCLNYYHI